MREREREREREKGQKASKELWLFVWKETQTRESTFATVVCSKLV